MPHAAFTIASEGTLPAALALSRSYLSAHPAHRFHVVAVGAVPALSGLDPRIAVHPAGDVPVPRPAAFLHQYTNDEACAALRPHAMAWLLEGQSPGGLLYLGPETFVLRPLDEAWAALSDASVLLVPRLRAAFPDARFRAASAHVRAHGVFAPGVVGVRSGPVATRFLDWWGRELHGARQDRVGPAWHLDQRFLDQAPWLFDGVAVLREPGYAVDDWNLQERGFALADGRLLVDGAPLALFDFRGRDPGTPGVLGHGPSRVHVDEVPALAHLLGLHDAALREARGRVAGPATVDPAVLGNGVRMVRALSTVALQASRRRLAFPLPGDDPDGFCAFAARPDPAVFGDPVAPLASALLALRPDVAAAFPAAGRDPADAGFLDWVRGHGAREEGLGSYLERFGDRLGASHPVAVALDLLDRRPDLASGYPVFDGDTAHRGYAAWLATHGPREEGLDPGVAAAFARTSGSVLRVLDAWFSDPARGASDALPHTEAFHGHMLGTLGAGLWRLPGIDHGDLLFFARAWRSRRTALVLCWLRYNPAVRRAAGGPPSVFRHGALKRYLAAHDASAYWPDAVRALLSPGYVPARAQLDGCVAASAEARALFPDAANDPGAAVEQATFVLDEHGMDDLQPGWGAWSRALLQDAARPHRPLANLCGPLRDASGVGEAARALARALDAAGVPHARAVMPGSAPAVGYPPGTDELDLYGSVDPAAAVNLLVANADARESAEAWFGDQFRDDQARVAVWMWETERLPARFRDAARGLDAVVAASRFAADAIRATVDVPVHVVPLAPDFEALAHARADRARFGLPGDAFVLGYFFDANSVLERKNPAAVLEAFRLAFGERSDACLVLKVNSPSVGDYDYEQLRAHASDLNVKWVDGTLSRADTFDLMASLDAYVSLHRAEGFGLTLAEAMALGKPCIATGYSGNMDFMDADCALLVRHRVVATRRPHGAYPAGSRWAEPSVEDAAQHMRALRGDPALAARLGQAGQARVRRVLDPAGIGGQLAGLLREAAAGRPGRGENPVN